MGLFSRLTEDKYDQIDRHIFGSGRKRPPCPASLNYRDMARGYQKTLVNADPSLGSIWNAKHSTAAYYLSMVVGCHMYKWLVLRDLATLERQVLQTGGEMEQAHILARMELSGIESEAAELEAALRETFSESFSARERRAFVQAWKDFGDLDEKNVTELLDDRPEHDEGDLSRSYLEWLAVNNAGGPLLKM